MKIVINCSNLKIGGGLQVAHSFLNEISNNQAHTYFIILSNSLKDSIKTAEFSSNFNFLYYDLSPTILKVITGKNRFLDGIVKREEIDVVFSVFGPTYWKPSVPHICGYAKPQYVYKESPFYQNISLKARLQLKFKEFLHLYDFKHHSDLLISENQDVSERISKMLHKKVVTVTNNYNQIFDKPDSWKLFSLPKFDGDLILTVSVNYPHKNLKVIPKIIDELQKRDIRKFKFVVALEQNALSNNSKINEDIIYIGKVAIDQCPFLYQQSKYMLLPTLLECFSASYAEAMKMEKIILTSDLGFAKSICKNAAIYFNPLNPIDILEKLLTIDQNSRLQKDLVEKGKVRLMDFDTSKQRAEKYLEIISNT